MSPERDPAQMEETKMRVLDYGTSFLQSQAGTNRVRFWVESRTRVVDERDGRTEDFYACGSCKSERMWGDTGLLQEDNYDFLPIFGSEGVLVFRRRAWLNPNYRTFHPLAHPWSPPTLHLREAADVRELETNEAVRAATDRALPLVARTEIANAGTGLRAILEYPVKTMNIEVERTLFQVDTGPVALPDLTRRHERLADSLSLAFVAFNAFDYAEVVVETPTPLESGGSVYHYSERKGLSVRNRLYAVGG